ncbi:MAG: DUF4377 domain-containing protein [Gelidibacter sp.]
MTSKFLVAFAIVLFSFSCSNSSRKIIYIADAEVDCEGVTPQKCLQIKEEGTTEWTYFYDHIEGFDYEKGFFYKLKVAVTKIDNPPADGSSLHYKLIEVLAKSKVPLILDQGSWMVTRLKDRDRFGRNPIIKIDLSQSEINGNTSCNRFSAKIAIKNNKMVISHLSSTEMLCKDIDVEVAFLEALKSVYTYALNEEKLQLLDENKNVLIECDYLKHE